jgi:hypothetical protein
MYVVHTVLMYFKPIHKNKFPVSIHVIFFITTTWQKYIQHINYLYHEAVFPLCCATSSSICLFILVYGRELCLYAQTLLYSLLHYSVPSAWLFRQLRVWGPETPPSPPLFLSHTPHLSPHLLLSRDGPAPGGNGRASTRRRAGTGDPGRAALLCMTALLGRQRQPEGGGEGLDELPGIGNLSLIIC